MGRWRALPIGVVGRLLLLLLIAGCACNSGQELSGIVDDFCRGEVIELELAQRALKAGRTDTALGDPSSRAFSSRVYMNFHFCRHARRIPSDEDTKISVAYGLTHDRYRKAIVWRRDLNAASREMSAIVAAYRQVLSYPLR